LPLDKIERAVKEICSLLSPPILEQLRGLSKDYFHSFGIYIFIWAQVEHILKLLHKDLTHKDSIKTAKETLREDLEIADKNYRGFPKFKSALKLMFESYKNSLPNLYDINIACDNMLNIIDQMNQRRPLRRMVMHDSHLHGKFTIKAIQKDTRDINDLLVKLQEMRVDIFHPKLKESEKFVTNSDNSIPSECSLVAEAVPIIRYLPYNH